MNFNNLRQSEIILFFSRILHWWRSTRFYNLVFRFLFVYWAHYKILLNYFLLNWNFYALIIIFMVFFFCVWLIWIRIIFFIIYKSFALKKVSFSSFSLLVNIFSSRNSWSIKILIFFCIWFLLCAFLFYLSSSHLI